MWRIGRIRPSYKYSYKSHSHVNHMTQITPKALSPRIVVPGQWLRRDDLTNFDAGWAKAYWLQGWQSNDKGNLVNSVGYEYIPRPTPTGDHRVCIYAADPRYISRMPEKAFQKIAQKSAETMPEWKKYQSVQVSRLALF